MGDTSLGLMAGSAPAVGKPASYKDWNDALANAFFGPERSGQLVYLDHDDEAFTRAYTSLALETDEEAVESLAAAVGSQLCWASSYRATFAEFDMLNRRWIYHRLASLRNNKNVGAPPIVALLMLLSIAAESMGAQNTKGEQSNGSYYSQLEKLLGISKLEGARLHQSFMESSEAYWEALSVWLEDHAGDKGLPSAYALMHRYVGLPISQALIRDTERRNLEKFFDEQGFVAGSAVAHAEMQAALDIWLHAAGGSANQALRKIWAATGNQSRVTELALAEFAAWEGPIGQHIGERASARSQRCLLTWRTERKFLSSISKFGLVVMQGAHTGGSGTIEAEDGSAFEVSFRPAGNSTFGVSFGVQEIEPQSLFGSEVRITTSDAQVLRRIPKNVVIFTRDALTASFVEVDRVMAGVETRILVKDVKELPTQVESILTDAAQPGFSSSVGGGKDGTPAGWVAYTDVTFLRSPASELVQPLELAAFQPRMTTQMSLQGGLRLPGRTRRWSALAPLTLVITSDEDTHVDLYRVDRDPKTLRANDVPIHKDLKLPAELAVNDLSDGETDFTLSLRKKNSTSTLQNLSIKLRGAEIGEVNSSNEARALAHAVGTPLWPLTTVEDSDDATGWVMGVSVDAPPFENPSDPPVVPTKIRWSGPQNVARAKQKLSLPGPAADSCIITGSHRFVFPTFDGKRPKTPWMYGVCSGCGASKRQPTQIKNAEKSAIHNAPAPTRNRLPEPVQKPQLPELTAFLDALIYLGSGTRRDFSVLARQVEDSALFERQLLMTLESSAFLEVERNSDMEVMAWESAYHGIAGLDDGAWMLAGPWTNTEKEELVEAVNEAGGDIRVSDSEAHEPLVFEGIVPEVMPEVVGEVIDSDIISPLAARKLAETLPPLSQIVNELPKVSFPFAANYEYFQVGTAAWAEIETAQLPGLYRLPRVYGSGYYLRTVEDVENETGSRVWAELGKHLAANILDRPLIAYDEVNRKLRVPLGAELPGLYGRVAVCASGQFPVAEPRLNSLTYMGLAPETVAILNRKLTS